MDGAFRGSTSPSNRPHLSLLEPKNQLRLADSGCDPPAPCPARQDKPDLKIGGAQRATGGQAGKADDFARGLFRQNRRTP